MITPNMLNIPNPVVAEEVVLTERAWELLDIATTAVEEPSKDKGYDLEGFQAVGEQNGYELRRSTPSILIAATVLSSLTSNMKPVVAANFANHFSEGWNISNISILRGWIQEGKE